MEIHQRESLSAVAMNILCGYDSHFLRDLNFMTKFLISHAIVKGENKPVLSVSRQTKLQNLVKITDIYSNGQTPFDFPGGQMISMLTIKYNITASICNPLW